MVTGKMKSLFATFRFIPYDLTRGHEEIQRFRDGRPLQGPTAARSARSIDARHRDTSAQRMVV
jgi:hypothetical protein